MEFYHGTTLGSARGIIANGFRPRGGAVWFTNQHGYAKNRAEQKARRKHDRPIIFSIALDVDKLRTALRPGNIHIRGGVIAVNAHLPTERLGSDFFEFLATPAALAEWINRQLGLQSYNGVSQNHWGVVRLAHWMHNRLLSGTGNRIDRKTFFAKGAQWLPTFFHKLPFSPEVAPVAHIRDNTVTLQIVYQEAPEALNRLGTFDAQSTKGIADISAETPKRRIRGLLTLEKLGVADLFEWCVLHLEDESVDVVCNALRIMQRCEIGYSAPIVKYAGAANKRIRAGALAALAKHGAEESEFWFERGLKDSETCVRMEVARLLPTLDRIAYPVLFELARHDPNPAVKRSARKRA